MSFLQGWVESPLAGAVGWTLLHSLWEGAIISAALAAALMAMRSPRARYAAACGAMLVMLGAFALTLMRMLPEGGQGLGTVRPPAFPAWKVPSDMTASPANPGLAALVPWLAPFWIAGVWIFYLMHAVGWISAGRLRRRGVCCAPERWQKTLASLGARLRVSRPVLLLESCLAETPMVVGYFRPVILMPVGLLAGLPVGQVEAVLAHELAHIRRHDYLVNIIQRLVESLLFYHPGAWWISGVIRAEREKCCDDAAVAITGDAHEYAVALASLEHNRWPGREPAVAATGGSLMKRIRRLRYPEGPAGAWTALAAAVVLMATTAVALAAWQSEPPQGNSAARERQTGGAESSPYLKWLNEDAAYIIDEKERAAYQRLTTDEEREKFIEQFWLRRDPTPGTPENEFRKEHYRRIAYANERFAAGRPGWKTDRGHMYIVYGPPDEMEAHPGGAQQRSYPYEVWMYRYLEGIGLNLSVTFIDRNWDGDYRLAPGNAR